MNGIILGMKVSEHVAATGGNDSTHGKKYALQGF